MPSPGEAQVKNRFVTRCVLSSWGDCHCLSMVGRSLHNCLSQLATAGSTPFCGSLLCIPAPALCPSLTWKAHAAVPAGQVCQAVQAPQPLEFTVRRMEPSLQRISTELPAESSPPPCMASICILKATTCCLYGHICQPDQVPQLPRAPGLNVATGAWELTSAQLTWTLWVTGKQKRQHRQQYQQAEPAVAGGVRSCQQLVTVPCHGSDTCFHTGPPIIVAQCGTLFGVQDAGAS